MRWVGWNVFTAYPGMEARSLLGSSNPVKARPRSGDRSVGFSRSELNSYLDWPTRFIKILAFKTAKVAGISELI